MSCEQILMTTYYFAVNSGIAPRTEGLVSSGYWSYLSAPDPDNFAKLQWEIVGFHDKILLFHGTAVCEYEPTASERNKNIAADVVWRQGHFIFYDIRTFIGHIPTLPTNCSPLQTPQKHLIDEQFCIVSIACGLKHVIACLACGAVVTWSRSGISNWRHTFEICFLSIERGMLELYEKLSARRVNPEDCGERLTSNCREAYINLNVPADKSVGAGPELLQTLVQTRKDGLCKDVVVEPHLEVDSVTSKMGLHRLWPTKVYASENSNFCLVDSGCHGASLLLGFGSNQSGELPILEVTSCESTSEGNCDKFARHIFRGGEGKPNVSFPTLLAPPGMNDSHYIFALSQTIEHEGSQRKKNVAQKGRYWSALFCGWQHIVGMDNDGKMYCWGLNLNGQLGLGLLSTCEPHPQLIHFFSPNLLPVQQVACGCWTTSVLTKMGQVFTAGVHPHSQDNCPLDSTGEEFSAFCQDLHIPLAIRAIASEASEETFSSLSIGRSQQPIGKYVKPQSSFQTESPLPFFIKSAQSDAHSDDSLEAESSSHNNVLSESEKSDIDEKNSSIHSEITSSLPFCRTNSWRLIEHLEDQRVISVFEGSRFGGAVCETENSDMSYIHLWGVLPPNLAPKMYIIENRNSHEKATHFPVCQAGITSLYVWLKSGPLN